MSKHVLSVEERRALDTLVGMALLNDDVRHRLLHKQADALLAALALSEETQAWVRAIPATTLAELAQAILAEPQSPRPH